MLNDCWIMNVYLCSNHYSQWQFSIFIFNVSFNKRCRPFKCCCFSLFSDAEVAHIKTIKFSDVIQQATGLPASDFQRDVFFWNEGRPSFFATILSVFHPNAVSLSNIILYCLKKGIHVHLIMHWLCTYT